MTAAATRGSSRLVALLVIAMVVLASCSTRYDMGVVRDGDELVALSACDNDQQLTSVTVSVKRADGDLGGSIVWSADVLDPSARGEERIVLGHNDPERFRHDVAGQVPVDSTLLVDGAYPDTLAGSVVVEPDLGDDDAATPSGVVTRGRFEDDRRGCGEISFGFLWPVLWVVLGLIIVVAGIAAVGARIDTRREAAEDAEWEAEQRSREEQPVPAEQFPSEPPSRPPLAD